MKDFIGIFEAMFDKTWLREHILSLYRLERPQTFPAYQRAAAYTYDLLRAEGFSAELLNFPADGKTTWQDKRAPLGWDVSTMRLSLVTKVAGITDPVLADYSREPLSAVKHSVATPPEGITADLVTEAQMKAGEDVRGCFVLLNQATRPRGQVVRTLLDLGALGWVSDYLEDPHTTPDSVSWINAGTEHNSWHVQAGDRDFISFQITPRTGLALRAACESGPVKVHALSDGRRYETELPVITGLLPGEDPREVWIVSHMYEPLIDDNANGVIGSIAILKALRQLRDAGELRLRYSVRVVFAAEMYGYAAYAEHLGGDLSGRVIGALNTDGITSSFDKSSQKLYAAKEAPDLPGCVGNLVLRLVTDQELAHHPDFQVIPLDNYYGDDCFLSDATLGCPTVWIEYMLRSGYHHNSWLDESKFDVDATVLHLAYSAAWVRAMAAMEPEEVAALLPDALRRSRETLEKAAKAPLRPGSDGKAKMEFLWQREAARLRQLSLWGDSAGIGEALKQLPVPECSGAVADMPQAWFEYAGSFVFGRAQRGFPHDLVKLPRQQRKAMPGSILYNMVADPVARMDGKKTLRRLIEETEWDRGILIDDATVKSWLRLFLYLAEGGYFTCEAASPVTEEDILAALEQVGVRKGDTLLVHSGLSNLGYLEGGTAAVIAALRKAVGASGTFLAPAFNRPYKTFEGRLTRDLTYRPYDTRPRGEFRDTNITTGALPRAMLREADACRSGHCTHEWVAIGGEAEEIVRGHGLLDAPAGDTSPMKKALERGGSVLFLGCGINSNTFLHFVETAAGASYLKNALVGWIDGEGREHTDLIPNHLPGHRSFYGAPEASGFYREAKRRGLTVHEAPLGMGKLCRMELAQLWEIGMDMFREDPCATLCTDPECTFCRKHRT